MKKRTGIIGIIGLLALTAGFSFFSTPAAGKQAPGGISLEAGIKATPVKTMKAVAGTLEDYIRISGDVKAASSIAVYPDVAGTLVSIDVSPGDFIQAGRVVATVDPSRPGAAYSISPVDSPISGTVTEVFTEIGETVSTTVPVLEIGRLDILEIKARVSERYVNQVSAGQTAYVESDALPGKRISARVSSVSPVLDPASRTMEIRLAFTQSYSGIKAGMLADITLVIAGKTEALKVPAGSVTSRSGGAYMFVVSGSSVEMRPVTVGLEVDGIAEITSGLNPGEVFVYSGMNMLTAGSAVKVLSEAEGLPVTGNVEGKDA